MSIWLGFAVHTDKVEANPISPLKYSESEKLKDLKIEIPAKKHLGVINHYTFTIAIKLLNQKYVQFL